VWLVARYVRSKRRVGSRTGNLGKNRDVDSSLAGYRLNTSPAQRRAGPMAVGFHGSLLEFCSGTMQEHHMETLCPVLVLNISSQECLCHSCLELDLATQTQRGKVFSEL
jgi:hypothetical protein